MGSTLRKHLAASINKIESVQVYEMNRLLNRTLVEARKIEEFHPYVERHINLDFIFSSPDQIFILRFYGGKDDEIIIHSPIQKPKVVPRFFSLATPEINEEDFKSLKTIIFDLGREHIFNSPDCKTIKKDNSFTPVNIQFDEKYFDIKISEIEIWKPEYPIKNIDIKFCETNTEELASFFLPQITKIDLLNVSEFRQNSKTFLQDKNLFYQALIKPEVSMMRDINIRQHEMMFDYTNINLEQAPVYSIKFLNEAEKEKNNKKNTTTDFISEDIIKLLEPVYDLSDELKNEILMNLPVYQKTGAKFLFTSEFAFLYDQFELGKEIQAVMALKMLLRTRSVKNILIITSSEREFITCNLGNEIINGLWQSNLSLLLPDFAFNFYTSYNKFFAEKDNQSIITGLTYEVLEKSFRDKKIHKDYFSKYDAVICDDISSKTFQLKSLCSIMKNPETNYLWFLSDQDNQAVINAIQNLKPDKTLNCLGRINNSVHSKRRINYDFFIPLDKENIKVCKDHFDVGREHLDDVMGLGNILRFRPNVFQIFQNEQRVLNFVGNTGRSNKSDLLLYHISRIFNYDNRVLVYTQYEESGLKQISALLKENKINFVSFTSSDSDNQLKEKLEFCKEFRDPLVYLTNLKQNGIKFKFPKVSQLINFDNWWNPATRWQMEDKLEKTLGNITVFNYYYNDTIESKTEYLLHTKGLKDKLLLDSLSAEKVYSLFDESNWCDIFEIPNKHFIGQAESEYEIKNMKNLVESAKLLLSAFHFQNIETTANVKDHSFNITAIAQNENGDLPLLVKCFFSEHLSSEFINGVLAEAKKNGSYSGTIILTNGTISRTNIVLPENTILIDGQKLKKYLHVINMG